MKHMKSLLSVNGPLLETALFSAFVLTCLAPLPQLKAQSPPNVVFTEWNNTTLTATLNTSTGASYGTVTPVTTGLGAGPDSWIWMPPATANNPSLGFVGGQDIQQVQWLEPEIGLFETVNLVSLIPGTKGLSIHSDVSAHLNTPTFLNEASDGVGLLNDPSPPIGGNTGDLIFVDKGDAVPDAGSTFMLLGGALTLVGAISRKSGK